MMLEIWNFLLLARVALGDLEGKIIRRASCVKAGDELYLIGGEVDSNGRWEPLPSIYRQKLYLNPNEISKGQVAWSTEKITDFTPPGPHVASVSSDHDREIYYYSGSFSKKEDIGMKLINTKTKTSTKLGIGPIPLSNQIEKEELEFDIKVENQTLMKNFANPQELILVGGEVISKTNNKKFVFNTIGIYNLAQSKFLSYGGRGFKEGYRISANYDDTVYVFGKGIDVRDIIHHHQLPGTANPDELILGEFSISRRSWATKMSLGKIPAENINYSYTQEGHLLYLVGNNLDGVGLVNVLDLKTRIWSEYKVPGFIGYPNGCLNFHNHFLIHNFGDGNQKDTQFIDTTSWDPNYNKNKPSPEPQPQPQPQPEPKSDTNMILYITMGSLAVLGLLTFFAVKYYRKRKYPKFLPPEIIDTPILCRDLNDSYDTGHSSLFEITELCPEECFSKNNIFPRYNVDTKVPNKKSESGHE